jgi:hypothetical protein
MSAAPLQFLRLLFAGWVNRRQQAVIDYLIEENRVLREQLRGRKLTARIETKSCAWANTGMSSSRLYWGNKLPFFAVKGVSIPVP